MEIRIYFKLLCFLNIYITIYAVNHWVLNDNGKILQKIDSPFYMREPNNLIAFLDQIKYNDIVENTFLELSRQKELMTEQINYSMQFGMKVIEQAKCALQFYEIENSLTYIKMTKKYLKRINLKKQYESKSISNGKNDDGNRTKHPYCWKYIDLNSGICCYDHLKSLQQQNKTDTDDDDDDNELNIKPEIELRDTELEFNTKEFLINLIGGLENNPTSWKYHTLSSYYWRMLGNAKQAIECAKRAVMLAPRKFRDIPLLSLGIILWRSMKLKDADVILQAAVDHATNIPENHFALGVVNAMLYNYNRSIEHFNQAEQLDSQFMQKTKNMKIFVSCFESIDKKKSKMFDYVEFIKKEVNGMKEMENQIITSHKKLIQQQVPLGARFLGFDQQSKNYELLHRGQYCSTRQLSDTNEPVLFCDFYSDLQMRLENKDVDIDSLVNKLTVSSEAIIKRLSVEFHTQFGFDKKDNILKQSTEKES